MRGLCSREEVEAHRPHLVDAARRRNPDPPPLDLRDTYGKAFLQSINLWRLDDHVKAFVWSPRFAKVAADLLGVEGVRLYHDQALFKEAGDATFHAGWTLHRAGPNPTDSMREVMTVIWYADGARATEPENDYQSFDLRMWLKGTEPGEVAAGDRNPLLWPA